MTHIRLPFINRYIDRHGKQRFYFRRPGYRQVPLRGIPGSAEFMADYEAAVAGQPPRVEIAAGRTKPGTVNAAVVCYYNSLAFRCLAFGTQKKRRAILENFRSEHGDKRIALLPREVIVRLLGRMAPFAARNCLKTLRAKTSAPMTPLMALSYRELNLTASTLGASRKSSSLKSIMHRHPAPG